MSVNYDAHAWRIQRDAMSPQQRRDKLLAAHACLVEHGHTWAALVLKAFAQGIPGLPPPKPATRDPDMQDGGEYGLGERGS